MTFPTRHLLTASVILLALGLALWPPAPFAAGQARILGIVLVTLVIGF